MDAKNFVPTGPDTETSVEIQEIINYDQHWIIRKGNWIFCLILVSLLSFSWLVRSPDVVRGSLRLMAVNAPKLMVARLEADLAALPVKNEEHVQQGQILAVLQSTANFRQVLVLRKWILALEPAAIKGDFDTLLKSPLPLLTQLGDIQPEYQNLQNTLNETLQVLADGYYQHKKVTLLKDMDYLGQIRASADSQRRLLEEDWKLQLIEYRANESLAGEKVIAPLELNANKSKVIGKEEAMEQLSSQVSNNNLNEQNKQREILDVQKYIGDQRQKFLSELFNLKYKIADWMQKYVVVAAESGTVLFVSFLQENQLLTAEQQLFYIQPEQSYYYGQLMVAQNGLGKIRIGEKVLVRMASYPSAEFGYLTGRISYVSGISSARDSFLIKVDLPGGLRTNYKKNIVFRDNLSGEGEVITNNRRLFERVFDQVFELFKN
jgi:multidrug efflux pump subunit AcrA (membrane-fusion protein)